MLKLSKNKRSARGSSFEFKRDISRHIYLRNIQDTNETLFYHLLRSHMKEMLPMIYTPTWVKPANIFSEIYRRGRGLFISGLTATTLTRCCRASPQRYSVIVVTDGERILWGWAIRALAGWDPDR